MTNPFTIDAIVGYNTNPPPNDQSETSANVVDWDKHINKIGNPVKNYAEANFANVATAFSMVLGGAGITTVNTSYAVLASDRGKLINVNGGSGVTITTPDATTVGSTFTFGVVNTSSNTITFDGSGSQTINGNATLTIEPGAACTVNTDGSDWFTYAAPNDPSRTSVFLTAQSFEAGVADGNVVYWNDSNNEWTKAQAGTTVDAGLGIADVSNGYVYGPGLISLSFDQGALTEGSDLWLSGSTAGEITTTEPATAINLGRALSATQLWFQPRKEKPLPGQWVLIGSQTASNSTSLDFTTGIGALYDNYFWEIDRLLPATDDAFLYVRVSDDGGVSFEADASDYSTLGEYIVAGVGSGTTGAGAATAFQLTLVSASGGIGNAAGEEGYFGKGGFSSPTAAGNHYFEWSGHYRRAGGGAYTKVAGNGLDTGAAAINGIQFIMSTGNITSGTVRLYGVAK